jgi:cell fate regulator YaaT (PSP1 superfamily)
MGCTSCGTPKEAGLPGGCNNNGSCGTTGCNKLEVFDWLINMQPADSEKHFPWVEVRFKNTRKDFFLNETGVSLQTGEVIAVEGSPGHDIGTVTISGELVKVQMKRLGVLDTIQPKKVYRKATRQDIERWQDAIGKEEEFQRHARVIARDLRLAMKISDVECQGDGGKAIFYYTADSRIDFRELIKILARDFKVRIEMRQIGYRQEAARLGGIGVCGRELCCSTWLRDFRTVSTSAARYQQLSINPQKLAGQCGKLKCCLNYELDSYLDALKSFPKNPPRLKSKEGIAYHQKTDIFKRILYYSPEGHPEKLIGLSLDEVNSIVQLNKNNEFPDSFDVFAPKPQLEADRLPSYANVIEEGSLTRFDGQKRSSSHPKRRKGKPQSGANRNTTNRPGERKPNSPSQ